MKKTIRFMKMRGVLFTLSLALIVVSLLSMLVLFKFNPGIDFSGGVTAQLNTYFSRLDVARVRTLFSSVAVNRIYKDGKQEKMMVNLGNNISTLEAGGASLPVVKGVTDNASGFLVRIKNLQGAGWNVPTYELENALNTVLRRHFPSRAMQVFQLLPVEQGADRALLERILAKAGKFTITETKPGEVGAGAKMVYFVSRDLSANYTKVSDTITALFANSKDFTLQGKVLASGERFSVGIKGRGTADAEIALRKLLEKLSVDRIFKSDAGNGMAVYTVRGRVIDEKTLTDEVETAFQGQTAFRLLWNTRTRERIEYLYSFNWGSFNTVSATIGREVESTAFMLAIGVALIILLYIAIRFDYRFGLAAVSALVHDVTIMLGVISVLQIELSVPIVAAILTILGYSINDTIVVFDRIRENLAFTRKEDLPEVINRSITQSLSRTVITSLTTFLAVLSIYLFAGEALRDFAFTLIIGVVVGTYSSIYIASPVYLTIEKLAGGRELKSKKTVNV